MKRCAAASLKKGAGAGTLAEELTLLAVFGIWAAHRTVGAGLELFPGVAFGLAQEDDVALALALAHVTSGFRAGVFGGVAQRGGLAGIFANPSPVRAGFECYVVAAEITCGAGRWQAAARGIARAGCNALRDFHPAGQIFAAPLLGVALAAQRSNRLANGNFTAHRVWVAQRSVEALQGLFPRRAITAATFQTSRLAAKFSWRARGGVTATGVRARVAGQGRAASGARPSCLSGALLEVRPAASDGSRNA